MLPLKLAFNIQKLYYDGNPTGRLLCKVGKKEFFANSKEDLRKAVDRFIEQASEKPEVTFVQVGNEIRFLTSHCGQTSVYKVLDGQLILTTVSNKALLVEANKVWQSLTDRAKNVQS